MKTKELVQKLREWCENHHRKPLNTENKAYQASDAAGARLAAWNLYFFAESLIQAQGEDDDWIPCSKRLPEPNQMVWTYSSDDKSSYGYMIRHGYWEVVRDGMECLEVTHWMPLPTPPRTKDKKEGE